METAPHGVPILVRDRQRKSSEAWWCDDDIWPGWYRSENSRLIVDPTGWDRLDYVSVNDAISARKDAGMDGCGAKIPFSVFNDDEWDEEREHIVQKGLEEGIRLIESYESRSQLVIDNTAETPPVDDTDPVFATGNPISQTLIEIIACAAMFGIMGAAIASLVG